MSIKKLDILLPSTDDSKEKDTIVERIYDAVLEQRLPANTKLPESELCQIFNASRAHIRRALLKLSERNVVSLKTNRGAFVACPTPQQAREIFSARRSIEPILIKPIIQQLSKNGLQRLKNHIDTEKQINQTNNRTEYIRISGDFHLLLAELHNNLIITAFLKDLVLRTSIVIGLFGNRDKSACLTEDHNDLINAITERKTKKAKRLMVEHLFAIESQLDIVDKEIIEINLSNVL